MTVEDKSLQAKKICALLDKEYPQHTTLLQYHNEFELLIAVILSAQTTDEQVNRVLPRLFEKYPDASSLAVAKKEDVEVLIHATGFYRNKAKNIIACAQKLVNDFESKISENIDDLVTLPGVGRKTAGVVLYHIYGKPAIIVDTHFGRVCRRVGLAENQEPTKLEFEIRSIIPREQWGMASMVINFHGRKVCKSRQPECERCVLAKLCQNVNNAAHIK